MRSYHFPTAKLSRLGVVVFVALLLATFWLPARVSAAPVASAGAHIVRAGETLSSIARYYGVTVHALAQANGIHNPNQIDVGQHLWIPAAGSGHPGCSTYHYVQHGDTLSGIAAWFGVNTWALANVNGLHNANLVRLGMKLCIPSASGHVAPPAHNSGSGRYVVKAGDTLSLIARWHGTTVHHLMHVNGLSNPNYIYVGQRLRIW